MFLLGNACHLPKNTHFKNLPLLAKDVEQVELSCIVVLIKLTTPLSSDPASPLLDTVPKRNENIYAQKDLYKNAYNI